MPKLRPLEPADKKRQMLIVKTSFLALVGLLTLFMHLYLANRPLSPPPLKPTKQIAKAPPSVLGARTQDELIKNLKGELSTIQAKLTEILGNVQNQGGSVINEASKEVQDTAFDAAFDTAVIPVITQIQNLPQDQQDQIKQAICQ